MNKLIAVLTVGLIVTANTSTTVASTEVMTQTKLMAGTSFQTTCFTKQSKQKGPTVVIIGGMHGDEPAGYIAARRMLQWKVERGTLILIPDGNPPAIKRKVRYHKSNMNALFPGKAKGKEANRAAHALWQVIKSARPSLLLTLHESRGFHATDPKRYGQTFTYDFKELTPFMERVRTRLNANIPEQKYRFLNFVDPHPTCPTYQAWRHLRVPATSIETTRTLPLQLRVQHQLMAVRAFLDEVGLEYTPVGEQHLSAKPKAAKAEIVKPKPAPTPAITIPKQATEIIDDTQ